MKMYQTLQCMVWLGLLTASLAAQEPGGPCRQTAEERNAIMRKADGNFEVRHVNFRGNVRISDRTLRERLPSGSREGDVFTQRSLYKAISDLGRVAVIYPPAISDLRLTADTAHADLDILICIHERGVFTR